MCWEVFACRETNPFRTAMPCWRHSRPGRRGLKTSRPARTAASTLECVRRLGCAVERGNDGSVVIEGVGPQLKPPSRGLGLRELGLDHAHAVGHSRGAAVHQRARSAMLRCRGVR